MGRDDLYSLHLHGHIDESFSLYKPSHITSPYDHMELSRPYRTFSLSNFQSKGLLKAPPPLSLAPLQPPLLPLPASLPRRSFSCPPPPAIKNIGTKKHVKKPTTSMNKEEKRRPKKSTRNVGPEPQPQPKNIARVDDAVKDIMSSEVVFTMISPPPPSSLPLPTFSLRPKLISCKAAGIDAGATDDLRRLLRLD